jgi:hypothetical protein
MDENCVSDEAKQKGGITKWLHGSKLNTFFCSFFLMNVWLIHCFIAGSFV